MSSRLMMNRRAVLRASAAGVLLPALESLRGRAHAQAPGRPPLRFIALQSRDGTFESEFWPAQTPQQQVAPEVWATPLASIQGRLSPILGPEFDALRGRFSLLRGVGYTHYAFHRACAPFSCSENPSGNETAPPFWGSSADCIVENATGFYAQPPRLRALRVGNGRGFSFWRPQGGNVGTAQAMPFLGFDSVRTVLAPLFPMTTAPAAQPVSERELLGRLSTRYDEVARSSALSSEDRARVQSHGQLMRELAQRAAALPPAPMSSCSPLPVTGGTTVLDRHEYAFAAITAAFACDVTRIACISLNASDDAGAIGDDRHHANSHGAHDDATVLANCRAWDGWKARRVASLMSRLAAVTEADGSSLLDNTVLVWANEDGDGNHHSAEGLPILVAGGARGRLRMGQYLDFRRRPPPSGWGPRAPHPGFPWSAGLRSIMAALGVPTSEFDRQGNDGAFGQHIPNYGMTQAMRDAATKRRALLPYFSV
jgi:hypothetical protein